MDESGTTLGAPDDQQALRRKAALISLIVGVLMFVMKTGGYFITNSAAILSDAMESVVHVIATGIAFYSIILSARPADSRHPYGYGKVEYFSAGLEGALIVIAAIAICYAAVQDIIIGNKPRALDIGIWVVAAAGAINLGLGFYLIGIGRRTKSLVLVADGKHVLTDSYTSIGVLIGIVLVHFTGFNLLDPLFAIAVALNIIVTGVRLISESVRGLMNTADQETLERSVAVMNAIRVPEMIDMHRLRCWRAGERRFIDFHLTLPSYLELRSVHEIQDAVHSAMREEFGDQVEVLLHLDPCRPECCCFCERANCPIRHDHATARREFTLENAQGPPAYWSVAPGQ